MQKYFIFLLIFFSLASCSSSKDYVLDYDYSFKGKFKKYKSFAFMSTGEKLTSDDLIIQEAIKIKLEKQGYEFKEKRPGLLINYTLFSDNFEFSAVNQPDIKRYFRINEKTITDTTTQKEEEETENNRSDENGKNYHISSADLDNGTLIIIFLDRKKNAQVWRGYISGLYRREKKLDANHLKAAVGNVLNQYNIFAKGYMN